MVHQLIPKTLSVLMPGYYGPYYMGAGIQAGIRQLETTAVVLKDAGNEQAHNGVVEAISALQAVLIGINEIKAENQHELASLQQQAAEHQTTGNGTRTYQGTVIDDDEGDGRAKAPSS